MSPIRFRPAAVAIAFLAVIFWLAVSGIGPRFQPDPNAKLSFLERAEKQERRALSVSAAVLGAQESRAIFGVRLESQGIQALWLKIENSGDQTFWFLPAAIDPSYFSPLEAAYRFHHWLRPDSNAAIDAWFIARHMPVSIAPHSTVSGYVLTNLDTGVKAAKVLLVGSDQAESFVFSLTVPGGHFLGSDVERDLIREKPAEKLDLAALRDRLSALPCCTNDAKARRDGDPINLVVIEAKGVEPLVPFVEQHWHLTELLDWRSAIETLDSFLFGRPYLTSPVSALYLFGRREDLALQKIRSSVDRRNHLRLWLAPFSYGERRVWVGQISQDIGVHLTDQTWYLTTHKIGPDLDFDRNYILQDLVLGGSVEAFGYVPGVGAAEAQAPRRNLAGDGYFTDGLRLVVFLSDQSTPPQQVVTLPWSRLPER